MPLSDAYLQDAEARLAQASSTLLETFREARAALPDGIADDKARLWVEQGILLAGHSLRSWEASGEYFRAGPALLPLLDDAGLRAWVETGSALAELAAPIGVGYFRASPAVLPRLAGAQLREWARLGERLYRSTWKSISLAAEFFLLSPVLLDHLSLPELARLTRVLEGISDRSADLAAACLDATPDVVEALQHDERIAFLDFAAPISEAAWPEASLYFQRGPDLLKHVATGERAHYLELSTRVAQRIGRQAYNLFAEGAVALRHVREPYHARLIELAGKLVALSPVAAMSLVRVSPTLADRLRLDEIEVWHQAGFEILQQTIEGGEAYFRLESGKAEQMITSLSARVDLAHVNDLLRLYGKALTGVDVSVHPVTALADKGIGWVKERGATTEGTAIYLPPYIEEYDNKPENFSIFKVYATHQTAHLEFGSFEFDYDAEGGVLPRRRHEVEVQRRDEGRLEKQSWLTDMERYFDLFPERQLAADLFTLVEDLRIDVRIRNEYSGIRRPSRRVQATALLNRPDVRSLPLRQAFVENLVRASLDGAVTMQFPRPLEPLLFQAVSTLDAVREAGASVEDSAEATLTLYDLAMLVPNLPAEMLQDLDWDEMTEELLKELAEQAGQNDITEGLEQLPDGEEAPYESPADVDFRGDFKPELVQLLMRMRQQGEEDEDLSPLTAEEIKELLEKSVEIDMSDEFDMSDFNMLLENLEKEAGAPTDDELEAGDDDGDLTLPPVPIPPEVITFYYDEWDFRAADYKPRWCAVRQRRMDEGGDEYYERILKEHAVLVNETQRQFELLKPETFRKLKRLEDGEDIDLDQAIEFMMTKRAGHGEVPKIYWRRNKVERDVAVAFLIDMSASTDEEIEKHRPRRDGAGEPDQSDPRRYYQWLAQNRAQNFNQPPKRIIDLEKESLVLLTHALEVLGDRYGIYGFSGYGRENIEYYVIKDLNEYFDDSIRRRIDKMSPIRSTRMGPAIRHTTTKLMEIDARARILFLVSDGRPQDHGYGRDRTEKEYAIHDTHQALVEAKHKGIVPFALTVDKEGHDYLGQMCGDMAYEVLGDIELLPSRLPTLYRRLTE
jgi:nitric oxide reductase activation protein